MRAFIDAEVSRDQLIASLEAHRAAYRIVQGMYWKGNGDGRGCAVGCSIHDFRPGQEDRHALYPVLFGVPESLARLEDAIFEGLPEAVARDWPLRFTRAIQPGADLSLVDVHMRVRIVERLRESLSGPATGHGHAEARAAMDLVIAALRDWVESGEPDEERLRKAESAAEAAGHMSLGRDGLNAAWVAADAAVVRSSYTANAVRGLVASEEYRWVADTLIEEIERAPVLGA